MAKSSDQTYDFICFTDLAYEFDISKKKGIETKIRRRLRYHQLGKYNQERVDYIRQLKNDLYSEIAKGSSSMYFHKLQSVFADLSDFDTKRMNSEFRKTFKQIDSKELAAMINFAIYLYYLR